MRTRVINLNKVAAGLEDCRHNPFGRRVSSQGREKETRKKNFSSKWQIWGEGDIL